MTYILSQCNFASRNFRKIQSDLLFCLAFASFASAYSIRPTACPANSVLTISDNSIPSNSTFDLSLRFRPDAGTRHPELYVAVDNVFNAYPPFVPGRVDIAYYTGQIAYYYDRIGRTLRAGFRVKL